MDLSVDLAPRRPGALVLRAPVMAAAGVAGYGPELAEALGPGLLGALCTPGTTLQPRAGHPPPRMVEAPAGLLHATGLPNPGLAAVLDRYAGRWAAWGVPVILNACSDSTEGFAALARELEARPGVAGVELNLSCPNAGRGGMAFALDPDDAADAVAAVRRETDLPILAKLSGAAADVRAVARAVEEAGADAITAINTLTGLAVDRRSGRVALGAVYGGLSGPALKPLALRVVYEVAQSVRIPVVGCGGVATLDDLLDLLAVGASAVQVGVAMLADPQVASGLTAGLADHCRGLGLESIRALVGTALPARPDRAAMRGGEYRMR